MILQSKAIKAALVLDPEAVGTIDVPNGQSKFKIEVHAADRKIVVELNAKSLRRCVTAIRAAEPGGVSVVLQGKLVGNEIVEAGIMAQPKAPKPAAAPDQA